jgi:hypothetical protein
MWLAFHVLRVALNPVSVPLAMLIMKDADQDFMHPSVSKAAWNWAASAGVR